MKRVLSVATIIVLMASFLFARPASSSAAANLFTDVPTTDPFRAQVETAYTRGILPGTVGGNFYPNANLTRAQMAESIVKSLRGLVPIQKPTWNIEGADYPSYAPGQYSSSNSQESLDNLKSTTRANYVSIVPTWYMANKNSNSIVRNAQKTATDADVTKAIIDAKARGFKVMLKPQVDLIDTSNGAWRGAITPSNPSAWFTSYKNMINIYAKIAQAKNVELLDIGTEFTSMQQQNYLSNWLSVIGTIKVYYSGKLTYSANWDAYQNVSFWNKVNYMGIDAYFPLSDLQNPDVATIKAGWSAYNGTYGSHNWVREIKNFVANYRRNYNDFENSDKQVIFTEVGYTNSDYAVKTPWQAGSATVNNDLQARAYEAFFQTFRPGTDAVDANGRFWFLGAFFWNWNPIPNRLINPNTIDFTPQNKTAQATIGKYFDTYGPTFRDVPATNPQYYYIPNPPYQYIEAIFQAGITSGCSATYDPNSGTYQRYYCPDASVTRDQAAVFLTRAAGIAPYDNPTPTFTDVPKNYWAYPYIEALFRAGITTGCTTTMFCPTANVSKKQAAIFFLRAFRIPLLSYPGMPTSAQVAYSPQGSVLTGTKIYSPDGTKYAMEVSPYGRGNIGLFNRADNSLLNTYSLPIGYNDVKGLAWSPNNLQIAVMYHGGIGGGTWLLNTQTYAFYRPADSIYASWRGFYHAMRFGDDSTLLYAVAPGNFVDDHYRIP